MLPVQASSHIIYVDVNVSGSAEDGTSWEDAYTDLQDALAAATVGDEIWVAKGVYIPGAARTDTFALVDGVAAASIDLIWN